VFSDEVSRLGLGLDAFRSRDFEYCKEMVNQNFYNSTIFLVVVFAGKKQPKHVGKCHKFEKNSSQKL